MRCRCSQWSCSYARAKGLEPLGVRTLNPSCIYRRIVVVFLWSDRVFGGIKVWMLLHTSRNRQPTERLQPLALRSNSRRLQFSAMGVPEQVIRVYAVLEPAQDGVLCLQAFTFALFCNPMACPSPQHRSNRDAVVVLFPIPDFACSRQRQSWVAPAPAPSVLFDAIANGFDGF